MSESDSGFRPREGTAGDSRPPMAALAEGMVFGGRYRVVRHIATGGMGSVFEVKHVETDRRRALKVMHAHLFQSDEMRERFKREARIAAQVESEYIVDVSDAGVDEATGMPFLVMELLQGEEMGCRLERLGPLPLSEVMACLHQVGLALDKTHSRMIVHRDLKPENLFLTAREDGSPRVKILDFGVAKVVAEGATGAGATRSLGTPLYMAPEQFRTGSRILPAADIYALGMMAFTLLVGEPYWAPEASAAGDVIAFAMTAVHGPKESAVRRAAARGVTLPAAFDGWFARVTATNPVDRFRTASEAVRALGEALGVNPGTGTVVLPGGAVRVAGAASGVLQRASTSTGAAVGPVSEGRPRKRSAVVIGAAVVAAGVGILVVERVAGGGRGRQSRGAGGPGTAGPGATPGPGVGLTAAASGSGGTELVPPGTAGGEAPSSTVTEVPSSGPAGKPAATPTGETGGGTGGEAGRHADRETGGGTGGETGRHADRETGRERDRQTGRDADLQGHRARPRAAFDLHAHRPGLTR